MFDGQFYPYQAIQFLDGLLQPIIGFGSSVSLAFFASALSTASTITWPASVAAGDIAVIVDCARNTLATNPGAVTPSGFTNMVNNIGIGNSRYMVSRKLLLGSETGALTGMNGTAANDKVLLVFRGGATALSSSTWNQEGTTGDPASQSVLASGGVAPLVVVGAAFAQTGSAVFSTASPAFDATVINGSTDLRVGYKIYNSAPADHTIDMADLGTNFLASGWLEAA